MRHLSELTDTCRMGFTHQGMSEAVKCIIPQVFMVIREIAKRADGIIVLRMSSSATLTTYMY